MWWQLSTATAARAAPGIQPNGGNDQQLQLLVLSWARAGSTNQPEGGCSSSIQCCRLVASSTGIPEEEAADQADWDGQRADGHRDQPFNVVQGHGLEEQAHEVDDDGLQAACDDKHAYENRTGENPREDIVLMVDAAAVDFVENLQQRGRKASVSWQARSIPSTDFDYMLR